jgi:fructokinase
MNNRAADRAERRFGAVEAGGTKFVCAVGDPQGRLLDEIRIETRGPAATLAEVCEYFNASARKFGVLAGVGIGAFGPLDLKPGSATFGFITSTPKPGWKNTDLAGVLRRQLGLPVCLDTDVNVAALGESQWGAGRHLESLAYVTVGTGIGVGVVHHGRPVHGLMHPELGHIFVRRHPADTSFGGTCPFHADCLEGLACGVAIVARIGRTLEEAAPTDPIWAIQADYLGQLCALLVLSHSPERILIGGGVMKVHLYSAIQARMLHWLNDYIVAEELRGAHYITAPAFGESAGIKGALSLAVSADR